MEEVTLYISIKSCGDGSASTELFFDEDLAKWDQEHVYEPFSEECIDELKVYGDNLEFSGITTLEDYFYRMLEEADENEDETLVQEFIHTFFKDGNIPKYDVSPPQKVSYGDYIMFGIGCNGKFISDEPSFNNNPEEERL